MHAINFINNYFSKERKDIFVYVFLTYLLGLILYLYTLMPQIQKLTIEKMPKSLVERFEHLDYIVVIASFILIILGFFFESFILFFSVNLLGVNILNENLKYSSFLRLFIFANFPISVKFICIAIKNILFEPNMYLFFAEDSFLLSVFDLFNLSYMFLMFLLLKCHTDFNNNIKLGIFILISCLYRVFF
ncbi:hypothetical protein [Bacillus toyonensis]|uniref:hypothetical protein n=1 Tax=Bacillus toyonensis TaxID=155322 RepID=UPI000BFC5CDF|nr:hypothetical protein [Bacillus toyonensis]PHG67354.1 hypothetical protein COI59_11660 [Bacillus toyonensis]